MEYIGVFEHSHNQMVTQKEIKALWLIFKHILGPTVSTQHY